MINDVLDESIRVRCVFREQLTFLISVDTPHVAQGLLVAKAALDAPSRRTSMGSTAC
jgi:hypothetical protein